MALLAEPLSSREEEILFAIADGRTNPEVAGELHLSTSTIKSYVTGILEKLGARNRAHAVALAYHHGILRPQDDATEELLPELLPH